MSDRCVAIATYSIFKHFPRVLSFLILGLFLMNVLCFRTETMNLKLNNDIKGSVTTEKSSDSLVKVIIISLFIVLMQGSGADLFPYSHGSHAC